VITHLSQLVQRLFTVSHELSGVPQTLATLSEENQNLQEVLHDLSSQLANLTNTEDQQPAPGIADLQPSIRDLSHRVSAPTPASARAPAPAYKAPHLHLPARFPLGRVKKGPEHPPLHLQPQLRTLNTSYLSTIRDLARRSATRRSTPSDTPTPTKPVSSGRAGTTLTLSQPPTSTLTMSSPPPIHRLPPAQARAAGARTKVCSPPHPNKLRVR